MAMQESGRGTQGGGAGPGPAAENPDYNLISVLYHALKGADLYDEYIADAEASGDGELREFFADVQREEKNRAYRARELLRARLGSYAGQTDVERAAEE